MALVAGTGITKFNRRRDGSGFRDWVACAFAEALAESGVERTDIDLVVVASESDQFALQLNPSSVLASDLGLIGAAAMRVEGGGASGQLAVHAAAQAIWAGTASRVAVVGFEAAASALDSATILRLYGFSFDAWTDGMTGLNATALYGLSAQIHMRRSGATSADFAEIAVQNRRNAMLNPLAHLPLDISVEDVLTSPVVSSPYRRLDCSPLSDGAAVLILGRNESLPEARQKAATIVGIGAATDHARLGARTSPDRFGAKTLAMQRACAMAGLAPDDVQLAEIYDPYSGAQLQALEALGISPDPLRALRDGAFSPGGRLPVNLSGGLLGQGAPVGAVGVAQIAACARQLEGRYHEQLQDKRAVRFAMADTHGGIATLCAVTLLEAGR